MNDIDWEYAGILPYPTSLARLIAHGEEDESAFFFMTQKDKDYAIDYYYEHLLKEKGIGYNAYRKTLDYFLLYEYCEWICSALNTTIQDPSDFKNTIQRQKNISKN